MSDRVRFAVIGSAGLIGNYHTGLLTKEDGPYRLAVLCDIDEPRLREQCERLKLPGVTRVEDLVSRADVDAVIVATPHPLHARHAIAAVQAGKDVLCEKPLAASPADARALVKAVRKARRIGGIHYQSRCRPAVMKLKDMIAAGELGRILCVRLTGSYYKSDFYYTLGGWRGTWADEGGGVLINQAPHDLDLLCHFAAADRPAELIARWANLYHTNSQVEDIASAAGRFPNGVEFTLNVSVSSHGDPTRIDVLGSAGNVTLVGCEFQRYFRFDKDLVDFARAYDGPSPYGGPVVTEQPLPQVGPHDGALLHKRFAEAVLARDKSKLLVSVDEGLWSAELIYGVFMSGYTGRTVKLPASAGRYDKMLANLAGKASHVERLKQASQQGMSAILH